MPYGQLSHRRHHHSSSSLHRRARAAVSTARTVGKLLHTAHKWSKKHKAKQAPARAIAQAVDNVSQHNDMSISNMSIKCGRKSHKGHKQYSRISHQRAGFVRTSGSGVQAVKELFTLMTVDQLLKGAGSAPSLVAGITTDDWPIGPFALNPYQNMTGSSYLLTGFQPTFDKTFIHNVKGEVAFANELTTPAEVDVYFAVCKRDITTFDGPINEWTRLMNEQAIGIAPAFSVQRVNALAANVSPTQGAAFPETYGQSPFAINAWNQQWKVVGKHKFILGGGCSKKIRWNYEVNKMFDRQLLQSLKEANTSPQMLKGVTLIPFVVARGCPVWDASNASQRMATMSSVSLIYTVSMQCNVSYPAPKSDVRGSVQITDANFGFHPLANVANERLVDDTDDVIGNARADV